MDDGDEKVGDFVTSLAYRHGIGADLPPEYAELGLTPDDARILNIPGQLWERYGWHPNEDWQEL